MKGIVETVAGVIERLSISSTEKKTVEAGTGNSFSGL